MPFQNVFVRGWKVTVMVVMCFLMVAPLAIQLLNSSVLAADKGPQPIEVVIQCVEAFFNNDDIKIRGFMTDSAQTVLANMATTDASGYTEIKRAILSNHPLTKLAETGIRTEVITGAGGQRRIQLRSGGRITGEVQFSEVSSLAVSEDLSIIEVRLSQFEGEPAALAYQVILLKNKKKKDKPWQIASFYSIAEGGKLDEFFSPERLVSLRIQSNEEAIMRILRNVQNSQAQYFIGAGKQVRYAMSLDDLRREGLVGTDIASGKVKGYRLELVVNNNQRPPVFALYATPNEYNKSGRRSFVIEESGTLHGADRQGLRATPNDPEINAPDENTDDD